MPETLLTACPMDCPDTCSIEAEIENDQLIALHGTEHNPVTAGFICGKVRDFAKRQYHSERILYPMRRSGPKGSGQFERITWDEAIEEITARFKNIISEWGGEAILPMHYGGSNGFLADEFLDDLYFARLGASRLLKTVCAVPTTKVASGMYGKMPGVAFEDYPLAKFILIWGANPKASNIHLVPYLKQAKQKGAFIAVVDPRNNFSESEIDLHLPVLPGTDLPVALSMINYWREHGLIDESFLSEKASGTAALLDKAAQWPVEKAAAIAAIESGKITELAEKYANAVPAVVRCGWGVERNRNGGQAVAAILAMPALLGKFGVPGGGYTMSNSGAVSLKKENMLGDYDWNTRHVNMSQLGKILAEENNPPVKSIFVYNCNPLATIPNQALLEQGLLRDDLFTVVHEQVMTDTAMYADLVLPATTFLEQTEWRRSYGTYFIGKIDAVLPAAGEALPNDQVFARLGIAMKFEDEVFKASSAELAGTLTQHLQGIENQQKQANSHIRVHIDGSNPVQFKNVFPRTADGKIDLCPQVLGDEPFTFIGSDQTYSLSLITPSSSRLISSTFGEFNLNQLEITMNPVDAESRGIINGQRVRVYNEYGEVHCILRVSPGIRSGVVSMPKGAWRKASQNGWTANVLCPDHVQVVGAAACYNDARVEVEAIS